MPELPEVQAITELLAKHLRGRRIAAGEIRRPRLIEPKEPGSFLRALQGAGIEDARRRAKFIRIELDRGRTLLAHLRMTGHLFVLPRGEPVPQYASAVFMLDNGARLVFEDPRGLGTLRLLPRAEADELLRPLGVEPLSPRFTPGELLRLSRGRRTPLKVFLMDQRFFAGLGNIYAAEALWRAKLDPRRPAATLVPREAGRLHRAIRAVLSDALRASRAYYRRPGTIREAEDYQCGVYGREGLPCPRCRLPVARIAQGGRSTFYCPHCQR